MQIKLDKYQVSNAVLKQLINFFWSIDSNNVKINHEILPLKNIDLVFNFSSTTILEKDGGGAETLADIYFHGLSENYKFKSLKKNGKLEIIGVSFKPFGLFPFVGIPMKEFKGQSIDFSLVNRHFSEEIFEQTKEPISIHQKLRIIEYGLMSILNKKNILPKRTHELISLFDYGAFPNGIETFCKDTGIHKRQLERVFSKHVGISPKTYIKLVRYQRSLNHLIYGHYNSLTDVAYDNGYYDQMHFVRDFKQFTGNTPTSFLKNENYLKKISSF